MSTAYSPMMYLGMCGAAMLLFIWPQPSQADCTLIVTAGDDINACESGKSVGITDLQGNNTLSFPIGGTGTITGDIVYGQGSDLLKMNSGTIDGSVNLGNGMNTLLLNDGHITGSVTSGIGNDLFDVHSGTIDGSVDQGNGRNIFRLFNGTISGSVIQGTGNGTIQISGGSAGAIIQGFGANNFTMSGGTVASVTQGDGSNVFTWRNGGLINGPIVTGNGNDLAFLTNLTDANLSSTPLIDGGLGSDQLSFDNTTATTPSRYTNWETVELNNGSVLTLGGDFKLGDSDSHTGTFSINSASTLVVNQGSISAFTAGQRVTVNNNSLIDMTTGSSVATDVLTIHGNYTANNGQLALQSVLAGDNSPSDKLVVSQGTISGSTVIIMSNLGGPGSETTENGIPVVQAINGATGSDLAFSLRNGYVSAGAFEYYLYKGGVTPDTAQNWYLRSSIEAPPLPNPADPDETPTTPGIFPGEEPIPIYRPEVPEYSVLFQAIQQMVQGMLGTYHERMGEQSPQPASGGFSAGWGRFYGSSSRQSFSGTVSPTLDSSITGYQAGTDLYDWTNDDGLTQRVGIFVGHSRLTGDISGFTGGFQNADAGNTTLRADSLGTYWTLIGANRAYLDLVLMGTRFDGNSESVHGVKLQTKGHNILGSAEVGWPFPISQHWEIEPQAQLIIDRSYLDSQNDGISDVSFKADTNVTTRLGVRLKGNYSVSGMPLQPYVRANIWHSSAGTNTVTFNDSTDIDTEQKSTTMDLSAGATMRVSSTVSVYGELGYESNLDSNQLNGRKGTVGVKVDF